MSRGMTEQRESVVKWLSERNTLPWNGLVEGQSKGSIVKGIYLSNAAIWLSRETLCRKGT